MPTVVVTITANRFAELARRLEPAVGSVVQETAHQIEARVKVGMAGAHSGRMYGTHQASAPGEMPAVDTGNLINSVRAEMTSKTEAVVATGVEYAPHLEYGTVHMAARPFFTPAAEAERERFINTMRDLERFLG